MNPPVEPVPSNEDSSALLQAHLEASTALAGSNDPAAIAFALLRFAGAASAELAVIEDPAQPSALRVIAEADSQGGRQTNRPKRLHEIPAHTALMPPEVLHISNVSAATLLSADERARLLAEGTFSFLIAPLVANQTVTGLILFRFPAARRYSAARLQALQALAEQAAHNLRWRAVEAQLAELTNLYELTRALSEASDMLEVLGALHAHSVPTPDLLAHVIAEHNGTPASVRHLLSYEMGHRAARPTEIALTLGPLPTAQSDRAAFAVFAEDGARDHPLARFFTDRGMNSAIIFILREQGMADELIALGYETRQQFSDAARSFFNAVAGRLSAALRSQRALRKTEAEMMHLKRQVYVLEIVNQLAIGIVNLRDEQTLLDYATRALTTSLNADHGGTVLLEPDLEYGVVVSEYPQIGTLGARLKMRGNPLFELLYNDPSQPLIVNNVQLDPRVPAESRELFKLTGIESVMFVPIIINGRIIGSVGLDLYTLERSFSSEMIEISMTLANQLALGLENIRLLRDAQETTAQQQRINEIAVLYQQATTVDELLRITLTELGSTLGAQSAAIRLGRVRTGNGDHRP
ncbi:MAG: GAF domain-containing protein [Aggregatilineales bacterium]